MAVNLRSNLSKFSANLGKQFESIPALLRDRRKRWHVLVPGLAVTLLAGGLTYYLAVYRPAHATRQAALQTTLARRGDIILSASGSGTLQAANQLDLGFKTGGKLTALNVKVGDQVKQNQLLAELDNSAQQIQVAKAQQTLAGQTSLSAIATAQQQEAQAALDLQSAQSHLDYLISPPVYYWDNQVTLDQQAVIAAEAAVKAAASDASLQEKLKKARDLLGFAKDKLKGAQYSYDKTYVPNNFSVHQFNHQTNQNETFISAPSHAEILKARSGLTIAQGALQDAQNLYAALTGGNVPSDASGAGLQALEQARLDLQTAQDNLHATQLHAPFSGTVLAVNARVGDSVGATAILTVADLSKLYVKTFVDESDYALFKVRNKASVVFDALPDQTFSGRVVQVDPALDTSSGSSVVSGLVELDPTKSDLLIGMGASVDVIAGQARNAVVVPLTALHEYAPGKYAVFVMRNGKLAVQFVEVGLQDLVSAEIKSGLQPGDIVSTGLVGTKQQ